MLTTVVQAIIDLRSIRWLTPQPRILLVALNRELPAMVPETIIGKDDGSLHLSPNLSQTHRLPPTNRFGDNITIKGKNTLRIAFQNIGGFPSQRSDIKDDHIRIGLSQ
jgi:hypothetical protein